MENVADVMVSNSHDFLNSMQMVRSLDLRSLAYSAEQGQPAACDSFTSKINFTSFFHRQPSKIWTDHTNDVY